MEVCAVKPARDSGLDARDWEPVGEEILKEIVGVRTLHGGEEAYVVLVDGSGTVKACTQKSYPLPIAVQLAQAMALPTYAGRGGQLMEEFTRQSMQKAQSVAKHQESDKGVMAWHGDQRGS